MPSSTKTILKAMSATINKSVSKQQLSLVLAADRNVISGLLVAITSAFLNLDRQYNLKCYVLAIALTDSEKASIVDWLSSFTPRLELKFIDIEEKLFTGLYTYGRFSPAVYGRYFIAELIPEVTYPIYIDTDIIVQCDLSSLLAEFDSSFVAAGVSQGILEDFVDRDFIQLHHLQPTLPYVNSGFMVINSPLWRQEKYADKLLAMTKQLGDNTKLLDQDVFNILFHQKWQVLDSQWNTLVMLNPYTSPIIKLPKNANVHTVGKFKSWMFKQKGSKGVVKEFYRYLHQTSYPHRDCPTSEFAYQNPLIKNLKSTLKKVWQYS